MTKGSAMFGATVESAMFGATVGSAMFGATVGSAMFGTQHTGSKKELFISFCIYNNILSINCL
ncbi:MAG: hypothetical protein U9R36_03855 [Elusimicrobiota bacterium]|nr:hypothetical protein [Elusimicrobiota bacterium]